MKNLRHRFERFCFVNRNKGIPNLMLYIVLGSGLVYLLNGLGLDTLYSLLCFDRDAILKGQVWRLVTYALTIRNNGIFFTLLLLYCYYSLGHAMEQAWGTLRFNLFYLSGILLMDIFAMAFGGIQVAGTINGVEYLLDFSSYYSMGMIEYLNLSLLIAFATLYPDTHFLILFIIPVKAWILGALYLGITLYEVLTMSIPDFLFPHNLFPLVALANYFLFFGKDVANLLPMSWRLKLGRKNKSKSTHSGPIPFRPAEKNTEAPNYTHRCTVCGRTDVSNPELEFRYCSRCHGYHCYCIDHINDHSHVEE